MMALPTYLELVNEVLVRLREDEVTSVSDNAYSKLIGKYVNDIKRQVEDAYNWDILVDTITAQTSPAVFSYALTGVGTRFKVMDVLNDTANCVVNYIDSKTLNQWMLLGTQAEGAPGYYNFNGVDSNGDAMVDVYPKPDGVYDIRFNLFISQPPLSANSDQLMVPSEPVILGAVAKALAERGEDGGLNSSEAYQLYRSSLADFIAIEAGRYPEEGIWEAV